MSINIIERKAGPLKKEIRSNILDDLTRIVEQGNALGKTQSELASYVKGKFNINIRRQTISDLMKEVYASIEPQNIKHIQVKLETMFEKIFNVAQELLDTAETNAEKKSAMDLLIRAMEKFTQFLESFGIKEKMADNLNISGKVETISLNIEMDIEQFKQIQDLESKRSNV